MNINEICKNDINNKFIEYYEKNKSNDLKDEKYKGFKEVFFKLNEIIKKTPYLRDYFPRFQPIKGNICLQFLDVEDFIDDTRRKFQNNSN